MQSRNNEKRSIQALYEDGATRHAYPFPVHHRLNESRAEFTGY